MLFDVILQYMLHFLQKSCFGLLLLLVTGSSFAQKKVIFEKMRCYSMLGPTMQYLENPQNQQAIARQLYQTLLHEQQLQLSDTTHLPIDLVSKELLNKPVTLSFNNPDTGTLHLYFDCVEVNPYSYFKQHSEMAVDINIFRRSESVLQLNYYLVDGKKLIVNKGEMGVSLSSNTSRAIGIPYRNVGDNYNLQSIVTTASGFTETIRKSIQYLFKLTNESDLIEIKVPPAFVYNNFISEETYSSGQVIFTSFEKGAWEYSLTDGLQLIRYGERKGFSFSFKNEKSAANSPFKNYWSLLNDERKAVNEYFLFKSDIRDVLNNINYEILLITSLSNNKNGQPVIKTPDKQVNFLLKEKDTVAAFAVIQEPIVKDSTIFWQNQVYNGVDTASLFTLKGPKKPTPFATSLQITGSIEKQSFTIKYRNTLTGWKEIMLNGQPVAWVMGMEYPEKIFIQNVTVASSMLNQLLMIAFAPLIINEEVPMESPAKR